MNKYSLENNTSDKKKHKGVKKYVCIECGTPASSLYTEYSKETIKLTQCENCHSFVDKYVEHDLIIIFIDIILYNSQVYRHLLINKENFRMNVLEKNVVKIMILLIMFNVYISWYRLEEGGKARGQEYMFFGQNIPFVYQYISIFSLCIIDFFAYIFGTVAALVIIQRSVALLERYVVQITFVFVLDVDFLTLLIYM
ncbi:hypothetical protein BB560_004157 [Smittium megazygosporum]|uniref:Protein ARV n=1 Tax=Smittium megazygosporum TaxID=133381 RepID=A0A2T9Z9Y7_9FUNG|nr:hypothetical protein BB560_004157 [Smittium megazygosporum]